ncbi:hypothetical protein BpHYR1_052468 [Brachionus plicatilis]|uniref:Uncharacterized protein n=1 Tax=Brachionus plicatilis TaxID=10195 RepID=A0A3M7QNJ1_BRAPC|nr:hypothetical protein BpHYR1_052468 [Brachionus plicatilis]
MPNIKRLDKVLNAEIYKKIGIDPLDLQPKKTGQNGATLVTPADPKYLQSTDDDDDDDDEVMFDNL